MPGSATPVPASRGDEIVPVAFWLVPAAPDHGQLQARIDRLASTWGTARFEPHLSLHVGQCRRDAPVARMLAEVASRTPPVTLLAGPTEHSERYYRTLFVRFPDVPRLAPDRPSVLHELQAELEAALPCTDAHLTSHPRFVLDPHVSLMYGALTAPQRAALCATENCSGQRIRFDTLAAVLPRAGFQDMDAVDRWEVFGHTQLTGRGLDCRAYDRSSD